MPNHSPCRTATLATLAAVLCAPLAAADKPRRAAPTYSTAGVVNSATYLPGSLAPFTLITIFGSDLAAVSAAWESSGPHGGDMPLELGGVVVTVGSLAVPLYYVSPTQINLLAPGSLAAGDVKVRVTRQGQPGPDVVIRLEEVAPELFRTADGYVIAGHADGTAVTPTTPARPGEVVVLYGTGFGRTRMELPARSVPTTASAIVRTADFRLRLDGAEAPAESILYVGVTPYFGGLYQINLRLPEAIGSNPEVRIAIGDRSGQGAGRLAVSVP
jgi:uncharacterized protein (TIGR03437 family)